MLKTIGMVVALVLSAVTGAYTADTLEEWTAQLKAGIQKKETDAEKVGMIRDARCSAQGAKTYAEFCAAAYNFVIIRSQAEKAELELTLKSRELSPEDMIQLLSGALLYTAYNRENARTNYIYGEIGKMFHLPKKTTQR